MILMSLRFTAEFNFSMLCREYIIYIFFLLARPKLLRTLPMIYYLLKCFSVTLNVFKLKEISMQLQNIKMAFFIYTVVVVKMVLQSCGCNNNNISAHTEFDVRISLRGKLI